MAITYSTPYKNNTVASVSGTTFTSNGTPFVSGDVGRFLVLTSGAGIGQIRRIVGFTSTSVVTVDLAWNVSNISAFTDTAPAASDAWQMNLTLDDIDDGVHIIKDSAESYRMVTAAGVVTFTGVFVADVSKNFVMHAGNFKVNSTSHVQFGYLHPNGYGIHGCGLVDISTTQNGISNSTSLSNTGNMHFYGCNLAASTTSQQFWRLYRGNDHIVRFVDCDFSGNFGARVQGTRSALIRCTYRGNTSANTLAGIAAIASFGVIEDCLMQSCYQGVYLNFSLGVSTLTGPRFDSISGAIFGVPAAGATATYILQDYIESEITAAAAVAISSNTTAASVISFRQFVDTAIVDTALAPITASARRAIRNGALTVVDDVTTTSGTFSRYTATVRDFPMSNATIAWASGTAYGPYEQLIACYGYNPQSLSLPLATSSNVSFTMIVDSGVTASLATALTYTDRFTIDGSGNVTVTANATLDQLYDYAQAWLQSSAANMTTAGAGAKLISFSGSAITLLSPDNLTVNTGVTLSSGAKFNTINVGGTVTLSGTGALAVVKYTSSAGTFVTLGATGLVAGSRVRLFDLTTGGASDGASELINAVVAGTSTSQYVQYTTDKTIQLRVNWTSGLSSKLEYIATGILTSAGLSFLVSQSDCTTYVSNAVDGSTVTGLTFDATSVHADADELDNELTVGEFYAWYKFTLMSAAGIRGLQGAVTPDNAFKYRINTATVPLKIENLDLVNTLMITGGMIYRDDGASIRHSAGGSIEMLPRDVEGVTASAITAAVDASTVTAKEASLEIINTGVQKASKLQPHSTNL